MQEHFLGILFGRLQQGHIALSMKDGKGMRTRWFNLEDAGALEEMQRQAEAARGVDVYFSTCPARERAAEGKRISHKMVSCVPALFLDVDTLEDATKQGKSLPATATEAANALHSLQHPPTVMVCSGHGIHAYWVLQEPIGDLQRAKATLSGFAKQIAQEMGYTDLDTHASEPARVLRVPGTFNHKNGARLPVEVIGGSGELYPLEALYSPQDAPQEHKQHTSTDVEVHRLTDSRLIEKASGAKGGERFAKLYSGAWKGAYKSQSEADIAFCNMLAFWTGGDAQQMDAIFHQSGLYRAKWDEQHGAITYGQATINAALDNTTSFYNPSAQRADDALAPYRRAYAPVFGYSADRGALYAETEANDGSLDARPLANFAALITQEVSRDDGVEVRKEFTLEGITGNGQVLPPANVPAKNFPGMAWALDNWGAMANIYPGTAIKDKMRYAIQEASAPTMQKRTVYTHSGWRKIAGHWAFLYHGGAVGVDGVSVELGGALSCYVLPSGNQDARASWEVCNVLPFNIAMPLLAHMYLAPLYSPLEAGGCAPAYILYLAGASGSRKTTAAALALSHFGASFDAKHVPASFADTANAVQQKAFELKDMPLLVDDYAPSTNPIEQRRKAGEAQKLIRAWGDHAERGRMRADSTLQAARPPRGLGFMTGEDVPDVGESGLARLFVVDVKPGDVKTGKELSILQRAAGEGALARAMRGYIEWLLPQMDALPVELAGMFRQYREGAQAALEGTHGRQPEAVACLLVGWRMALRYWTHCGIAQDEEALFTAARQALITHSGAQHEHIHDEQPVRMFLDALAEMDANRTAGVRNVQGVFTAEEYIGYSDASYIYLIPGAAYAAVQEHYKRQNSAFPVSKAQLWKRMANQGLIETREGEKTLQKHISGIGLARYVWVKRAMVGDLYRKGEGTT